jgi:prevent-host-death family protein
VRILGGEVGTRALKNRLGEYLEQVKAGQVIQVTDRGKVIAEIRPRSPGAKAEAEVLRRLAAEGVVTQGESRHEDFAPYPVTRRGKRASRMIIEDRT